MLQPTELKIWPNPVNRRIYFDAESFMGENAMMLIFDSKGQKVLQTSKYINAKRQTIELPELANAVYYIQIISKKQSATGKFIKQG